MDLWSSFTTFYNSLVELFFTKYKINLLEKQIETAIEFEKIIQSLDDNEKIDVLNYTQNIWKLVRHKHGADLQFIKAIERRNSILAIALIKKRDQCLKNDEKLIAWGYTIWITSIRSQRSNDIEKIARRCWKMLLNADEKLQFFQKNDGESKCYRLPYGLGLPDDKRCQGSGVMLVSEEKK